MAPSIQVGWLLAKVNKNCPVSIPSLHVAEQPVAMALSDQTIPLPTTSLDLINTCMNELQKLCNSTSSSGSDI